MSNRENRRAEHDKRQIDQYGSVVLDGHKYKRLLCWIRGHWWAFHPITLFGTSDVDAAECHRCGQLRVKGDGDAE